jgi:hypothetical protein
MGAGKALTWIEWSTFGDHGDVIVEGRKFDVRET